MISAELVERCRQQFPALKRQVNGHPAAFFDGPGGTQTPQRVIDAVGHYLATMNANHEGRFATSRESDAVLEETHRAAADLLCAPDPDTVYFGPNMTTLTFALSRSLARTWSAGDEIVVTRLDHDANYSPWVLAARDAGATVRVVEFQRDDCTLDLDDLRSKLSDRTKLVAVGCASNAVGTVNPVKEIGEWAHECGAGLPGRGALRTARADRRRRTRLRLPGVLGLQVLRAARRPDVGAAWVARATRSVQAPTGFRAAPPGRWMSGTQNHEGLAGTLEAINYMADLGRDVRNEPSLDRPAALNAAFAAISEYESALTQRLLDGLADIPGVKVWGVTESVDPARRLPTVAITHPAKHAGEIAEFLGQRGLFVWDGNYYALNLSEALGHEPHGMVRIGLVHYNTAEEIERLLAGIAGVVG